MLSTDQAPLPPPSPMDLRLRPATQADVAFILATWKRSQRKQGDNQYLTNRVYFEHENKRLIRLLSRPNAQATALTTGEESSDHLFGYVVHEMIGPVFVVHFAYVKRVYQGMGIMTLALKRIYPRFMIEEIAVTHITDVLSSKRERYLLKFNPYIHERGEP